MPSCLQAYGALYAALLAFSFGFVGYQVLSWRRSAGERRQQVKWLASGAVVTIVSAIIAVSFSSSGPTSTLLDWADNLAWFGLAALPVSMGVGSCGTGCTRSTGSSPARWPTRR